ncbi:MAG: BamA/TamA family outer membrane protein [Candidatus Azobacteroides sp.]|nr:BamA/TamA family outer membrane protein [Candidatus Azobacteroides sp.]
MPFSKYILFFIAAAGVLTSCNTTKFVPDGEYLLNHVEIKSKPKIVEKEVLLEYFKQQPNYRVFGIWNMRLGIYNMAGKDSSKWMTRLLKKVGSPPVIYDKDMTDNTVSELQRVFYNMGYMDATVSSETEFKKKKATVIYTITPNTPYRVGNVSYQIQNPDIARFIKKDSAGSLIKKGMLFNGDELNYERARIVNLLKEQGYYAFSKDNIHYFADSSQVSRQIDLTVDVRDIPFGTEITDSLKAATIRQDVYFVKDVYFLIDNVNQSRRGRSRRTDVIPVDTVMYERFHILQGKNRPFRPGFLAGNCFIHPDSRYNENDVTSTYNALSSLQALRYANIRFEEVDSAKLNCYISIISGKPQSISASLEGTNSAGDLGVAGNVNYQHRNIFHGSEVFNFKVRGSYEALTGNVEDLWKNNYTEIGAETSILFPKFQFPFLNKDFKKRLRASTEYSLSFARQARPEYERIVFSGSWRYKWAVGKGKYRHTIDPLFFDYVHIPYLSDPFIDDLNKYPALMNSFEDHVIAGIAYSYYTTNQGFAGSKRSLYSIRTTVESSGNTLSGLSGLFHVKKSDTGQYDIFGAPISQYVKGNIDYSRSHFLDENNSFAYHIGVGAAYPYSNSYILPFEKRFYSGGANSVRGWSVRTLGPGTYKYTGQSSDYAYQAGDIRLDMNVEWRSHIFWVFQLAAYIDAGNIWTIKDYDSQPGGVFKFNEFYKQIAASYGLGLRLDFKYFLIRLDTGMKAYDPSMIDTSRWVVFNPDLSRDFAIHFAIGYPF